jgi:predicted phosphodiesterase
VAGKPYLLNMKILTLTDLHRGFTSKTSRIHDKFFQKINENETFDCVIISGDLGTSKTQHTISMIKALRKAFPSKPIYIVLGNHDLWDPDRKVPLGSRLQKIRIACTQHNVHYLEGAPVIKDDIVICGVNGWYSMTHYERGTNDFNWMPEHTEGNTDHYLQKIERTEFYKLQDADFGKRQIVFVTHFPVITPKEVRNPYGGNLHIGEAVKDWADICIFGHSHRPVNLKYGKCVFRNAGPDYDRPTYIIIDTEDPSK